MRFCFSLNFNSDFLTVLRDYAGIQLPPLPKPLSGSNSSESVSGNEAAMSSSSTSLPSASAAVPSHSQLGPIPMPPIDKPLNVTDADLKPTHTKREVQPRQSSVNTGQVGEKLISSTHSLASPLCRCVETHQACYHNRPKASSEPVLPEANGIVIYKTCVLLYKNCINVDLKFRLIIIAIKLYEHFNFFQFLCNVHQKFLLLYFFLFNY